MKKLLIVLLVLTAGLVSKGQILEPAEWSYFLSSETISEGETELIFRVEIDDDWYLYSSDFDPDCGPLVTTFEFEPHDSYELVGEIRPINPSEKYDEIFECDYTYFKKTAEFRQTILIKDEDPVIKGFYEYQVCSDIDGRCIPFDDEFTLASFTGETTPSTEPQEKEITGTEEADTDMDPVTASSDLGSRDPNDPYSLLAFMIVAFLAGLAAILTPCVFPMIPVTVTFFTGSGGTRRQGIFKGLWYGLAIIIIYTVIGVVVSLLFGAEVANDLATSAVANIFFFAVFVFFGLSFLGLFEITIPSSILTRVDRQADKGGIVGIIFMAFTLVLVSFSCTGPLVGSILVESAGGQLLKPTLGMFSFALAFALPFALFAMFPGWLNSLPKSGGWMNSVKVVLGFLELALSLKFLSIADQVYHWGILDRHVFLAIWIVILTLMGFYLLGKIKLPGDSDLKVVGVPRLILAVVTFSFVTYLIPGLFGAPLKAMAGYLPPRSTQDFDIPTLIRTNPGGGFLTETELCDEPKYAEFLPKIPHGLKGYYDYEQAIACARQQNKPLFIDFTGHGCVNCREMEERVWSDPEVLKRLQSDFIMLALYVDDKKQLPENEWYESRYDGKTKKTIGKQNADFQITRFNNNAQPYYVILNADEKMLVRPVAYNLNIRDFVDFLDQAKKNYTAGITVEGDRSLSGRE